MEQPATDTHASQMGILCQGARRYSLSLVAATPRWAETQFAGDEYVWHAR
jgi:hypothetical protein